MFTPSSMKIRQLFETLLGGRGTDRKTDTAVTSIDNPSLLISNYHHYINSLLTTSTHDSGLV